MFKPTHYTNYLVVYSHHSLFLTVSTIKIGGTHTQKYSVKDNTVMTAPSFMSYQSVNVVYGALQLRFHFHSFLACTEQVKPTHFEFSMHIWMCFFAVPSKFQDFSLFI